jgi:hypothetical protein
MAALVARANVSTIEHKPGKTRDCEQGRRDQKRHHDPVELDVAHARDNSRDGGR